MRKQIFPIGPRAYFFSVVVAALFGAGCMGAVMIQDAASFMHDCLDATEGTTTEKLEHCKDAIETATADIEEIIHSIGRGGE